MSRNFFYISENKAGFSYRAFVICYIENNISRISHRRIIKSCIPAHNYNPNHLALSVAKCNPGSRKTVEHPLRIKSSNIWFDTEAPPPTLLYTTFDREGTLFVYLLLKNGAPVHIPSREIYIPFNCCKCTVYLNKPQNQTAVSRPFHSHKMRHLVLLGHFTNRNDKFPNPYIYFNYWIPCPFHIPGDWKRGFSPYRQLYPPPPSGFFPGTWYLGFLFLDLTKSHNSPIKASRAVFWSLSWYKELKLIIKLFTGRTRCGILI